MIYYFNDNEWCTDNCQLFSDLKTYNLFGTSDISYLKHVEIDS